MPLINPIIVLIIVGVLLWLVNTYIPMAQPVKTIINVLVAVVICLWLLGMLGVGNIIIPVHK